MIEQLELLPAPTTWASEQRRRSRPRRPRPDGRGRHENSLAAHSDERLQRALAGRRAEVLEWVRLHGPCTVRQVLEGLYHPGADMDLVRPRVTELIAAKQLVECNKVVDHVTGRPVMVVDAVNRVGSFTT
ncbi:MAG: hypothetical protein PHR35_04090 [Kiritimatiellae bacterium]|nr:hypothetical protein [Kiritimatiellia bacterium]